MNTTMENNSDVYIYRVYFENNREARMMDIQEIIELVKRTKKFILNREMVSDIVVQLSRQKSKLFIMN